MARVWFQKPLENIIYFIEGDAYQFKNWPTEEGFIINDFWNTEQWFIKGNAIAYQNEAIDLQLGKHPSCIETQYDDFFNMTTLALKSFDNTFVKVALAKKKILNIETSNIFDVFINLCNSYKDTFTYLVQLHNNDVWIGSTPELFLSKNHNEYKTCALAGTIYHQKKFTNKENIEQNIVTEYIKNTLIELKADDIEVSNLHEIKSGNLTHLKNEINFKYKSDINILIKQLHPTPAVAGFDKSMALTFIKKNETINRELYSGFLGPVNQINQNFDLFVNLRCAKVYANQIHLYSGAGIVKGSIAIDEWEETNHKCDVIGQFF